MRNKLFIMSLACLALGACLVSLALLAEAGVL